jgi:two-component system, OmpR family, sensor histidine kinase KdpD
MVGCYGRQWDFLPKRAGIMPFSDLVESQLDQLGTQDVQQNNVWRLLRDFGLAAVSVIGTAIIAYGMALSGYPSPESLSVLFVLPVLFSAVFINLPMALVTSLMAAIAYNLVLLPPLWHIGVTDPGNAAKLITLVIVAVIASALASRIRRQAKEAKARERVLAGVYTLSHEMLGIAHVEEMRKVAEAKLGELLDTQATIILKHEEAKLDAQSRYCLQHNMPTGKGMPHFAESDAVMLPLNGRNGAIGILALADKQGAFDTARYPSKVLATLAAQTAAALEKALLSELHEKRLRDLEKEKFLAALLSSVSHDFKTPLVTVIGVLSSLQSMPAIANDFNSRELTAGGLEEARKLNRYINNLVEISRLEAGMENLHREPVVLRDILAGALKSLHPLIRGQRLAMNVVEGFPLLRVNPALMELVFLNLLENALKYGPDTGEIRITAHSDGTSATIYVDNEGAGIPPSEREAIFVKFYRAKQGDNKIAGTGLGLYICRAIVQAHGGSIAALTPDSGEGTRIAVVLPACAMLAIADPRREESETAL